MLVLTAVEALTLHCPYSHSAINIPPRSYTATHSVLPEPTWYTTSCKWIG
jgi:hypothetical protein